MYPYRTSLYPVLFYASSLSEPQISKSCEDININLPTFCQICKFSTHAKGYKENFQFRLRGSKVRNLREYKFFQVHRKYLLSMINVKPSFMIY